LADPPSLLAEPPTRASGVYFGEVTGLAANGSFS
jgi:hypothetical protein